MKRTIYSFAIGAMAIILSAATVSGQGTQLSADQQKQKEADLQKKLQTLAQEEQEKLKQVELDAKKRVISEEEMQKKIAEIEAAAAARELDFEWQFTNAEELRKHADKMSKEFGLMVVPDGGMLRYGLPDVENVYVLASNGQKSKPGSSWNYSRQVMEATFTNEFTMSAADESSVNLSVAGDCAEGSIVVAIIMPDGKQLSEVVLDENGSLNWRKNFEAGENNGWKNGKWVFKIKAKEATGNLRISMNSN
jgi:cell division protein FtsB